MEAMDEYERKVNFSINVKLSMYRKIINEYEAYLHQSLRKEKDMKYDSILIEFLSEIDFGKKFKDKLIKTTNDIKAKNQRKKIGEPEFIPRLEKEFLKLSHVGCSNQSSFKNLKRFNRYSNEKETLSTSLCNAIHLNVKRQIFSALKQEHLLKAKTLKPMIEESLSRNLKTDPSLSEIKKTERSVVSSSYLPTSSTNGEKVHPPLFVHPERKKHILTKDFVLNSISKYNINGELQKEVRLKDIMKTLNIKEKQFVNSYNLDVDKVKEINKLFQDCLNRRVVFNKNNRESRNHNNMSILSKNTDLLSGESRVGLNLFCVNNNLDRSVSLNPNKVKSHNRNHNGS